MQSGEVLELCDDYAKVVDKVHTGAILCRWTWCWRCWKYRSSRQTASCRRWYHYCGSYILEKNEPPACRTGYRIKRICLCRESEELMDDARRAVSEAVDKVSLKRTSYRLE